MKDLNLDKLKEELHKTKNDLVDSNTTKEEEADYDIFIDNLVSDLQNIYEKINIESLTEKIVPYLKELHNDNKKDT